MSAQPPTPPPAPGAAPAAVPSPERLRALLAAIGQGLLERDAAVRLALLAALAGEHVLLIGPPGTAKSALARRVHLAFAGARYFERLLTRFSTPEELFGPLSLKALEDDRYERLTEGFLPTAGIAFLDEVFKANSAILNALLMLLNERCFDNGTERLQTPLVAVVAASNEVPADDALRAFYDRFLVRVPVATVGDGTFPALLALCDARAVPPGEALRPEERAALVERARVVELGADFIDGCIALRAWLAAHDTPLSDRRWRQFVGLARMAAASEGRAALDRHDLWLAPFVAGQRPEDVPALETWFADDCAGAPPGVAPWLERAVQAFEKQLDLEQQMPGDTGDDGSGKLALARAIGLAQAEPEAGAVGMQRIVSQRLEARLQRRWSPVHVQARVAQVLEIEAQLASWRTEVAAQAEALARALEPRLWMPPRLVESLQARHAEALALLDALAERLAAVRTGFAALPIADDRGPGTDALDPPPPPVAFERDPS